MYLFPLRAYHTTVVIINAHKRVTGDETSPPFPLSARGEGAMSVYG